LNSIELFVIEKWKVNKRVGGIIKEGAFLVVVRYATVFKDSSKDFKKIR